MKSDSLISGKALTIIILFITAAILFFGIGYAAGYVAGDNKSEPVTLVTETVTTTALQVKEEPEEPEEDLEEEIQIEEENTEQPDEDIDSTETGSKDEPIEDTKLSWWIGLNDKHETPHITEQIKNMVDSNNAIYVGDTSEKSVYLTFDEGYEMGYTSKILDVLKENEVKSIFFITGSYIEKNPELVKRMIDEGHSIGNHTISHKALPDLSVEEFNEEITGIDDKLYEKFGIKTNYLRPPSGYYTEKTLKMTSELGYKTVFWSFAYDDWYTDKIRGADYAYDIVMKNLHNGGIYLLHAVSKDNADALDRIIKEIREEGYEIKSFDF